MTVAFRDKAWAAAFAAAFSVVSTAAVAAETPQHDLRPLADGVAAPETRIAQEGPVRLMPRRDFTKPPAEREPETPDEATPPPEIQVQDLGEVDSEAVGVLDSDAGGFGSEMWEGTPRDLIERLLKSIPATMTSPVLRSLTRRLLLSAAVVPEAAEGAKAGGRKPTILSQRIARLLAMGLVSDADRLIAVSPTRQRDPDIVRLNVENMLLAHDVGGACNEARRDPNRLVQPYWQKLSVFCQVLGGSADAARFGAQILAENPEFDDNAFLALVDRLGGADHVQIRSLPKPTALHLAMLRSANAGVPDDAVSNAPPSVLRAIATSPHTALDLKLEAAERAALVGAITPERLGEVYSSVEFDDEELANALTIAEEKRNPRGRALLYRAAAKQAVPTAKAAVIRKAFELARVDGQVPLVVRLYRKTLTGVPVSAELAWFAGDAARGLLALGDTEAAEPWLALLRARANRDPEARTAQDGMWALALIAGEERYRADDAKAMAAWLAVQRTIDAETAEHRAGLALTLVKALGAQVPERYWQDLVQPPQRHAAAVPQSAYPQALAQAAKGSRPAETVLLLVLMAGSAAPAKNEAGLLEDAISALRTIGLDAEARSLALEAALAHGL